MEKELMALGLSYYESKALNLLLSNKLNLRQISSKTNIPFGKVYSVIKSLKEKGLIKETNSRPKSVYIENQSEIISRLIEKKNEENRAINERLKQYLSEMEKEKGQNPRFFQIGTSVEDNKNIQLRTFDEAREEVLQILNIYHKPLTNRKNKTIWEKAIVRSVEKGIIFRSIYPKKAQIPIILERLNKKQPEKFQIKRLDTDFVRCDIIDNNKVLVKLVREDALQFGGILFIEDEKLNENLKNIFYELWENAE